MLKRIVILSVILTTLSLLVLVPMSVSADSGNMPKAQTTVEVTVVVETAVPANQTSAPGIPVTGNGLPMTALFIFGLIGLGVIIAGVVLMNNRPNHE